jgi:hypothetical protein
MQLMVATLVLPMVMVALEASAATVVLPMVVQVAAVAMLGPQVMRVFP